MANHPRRLRNRGLIAHEAAIALVLTGAILVSVVQFLAFSAQQSRTRHQRLAATREAANLMEQLMARSWDQLTPASVSGIELSAGCQETLPDAQLEISIADQADAPASPVTATVNDTRIGGGVKQLHITSAWHQASGNREAPVHLVAWKYGREETDE